MDHLVRPRPVGRSPAEVKKPWRTKNVGDSGGGGGGEDFMPCIMRHNTSSRLSFPSRQCGIRGRPPSISVPGRERFKILVVSTFYHS